MDLVISSPFTLLWITCDKSYHYFLGNIHINLLLYSLTAIILMFFHGKPGPVRPPSIFNTDKNNFTNLFLFWIFKMIVNARSEITLSHFGITFWLFRTCLSTDRQHSYGYLLWSSSCRLVHMTQMSCSGFSEETTWS